MIDEFYWIRNFKVCCLITTLVFALGPFETKASEVQPYETGASHLETLPPELMPHVMKFLNTKDRIRLSRVRRAMYQLVHSLPKRQKRIILQKTSNK